MLREEDYLALERCLVQAFTEVFRNLLVSLILYGSYARREARPDSDIDLLVIIEDSLSDRFKAQRMINEVEDRLARSSTFRELRAKGFNPFLSPYILTKNQARVFRPIYIDIAFDAKILYDPHGFARNLLEKVRKALQKVEAKRVKVYRGWVVVLKPKDFKFGDRIVLEI